MAVRRSSSKVTWMQVAVSNAGIRKGSAGIVWAWCWGITREAIGHDPTIEEVAKWWGQSERNAYREQAAFRQAFPMLDSPIPFVDHPEVKPLIIEQTRKMKAFAKSMKERKRPMDLAVMTIGFKPFTA